MRHIARDANGTVLSRNLLEDKYLSGVAGVLVLSIGKQCQIRQFLFGSELKELSKLGIGLFSTIRLFRHDLVRLCRADRAHRAYTRTSPHSGNGTQGTLGTLIKYDV